MEFNAVMIIGHFVVSIFNIQLGQPLYQFVPYPNMDVCQQQVAFHVTPDTGHKMSLEYKMFTNAQCVTREEFDEKRNAQAPQPVAPAIDGWELQ